MADPPLPAPRPILPLALQPIERRWLAISPNTRGALWMLMGGILFTFMGVLTKALGTRLDSFQIAFFRAAFGFACILPFALRAGPKALRTRRPFAHLLRGVMGTTAMFAGFYAVVHLPLADATALSFTRALFVLVLAWWFLGESVRIRRWSATIVGFLGVLVMLRPAGEVNIAAFVAIAGAFAVAGVVVMVKLLSRTEQPIAILFWFGCISTAVGLIPALFVWQAPTVWEFVVLIALGALGAGGQGCTVRAYYCGEATVVAAFDYSRLLFAGLFGFVFFAEIPDAWTWVGAAIIVASTLYIALREARLRREAAAKQAPR